MAVQKDICKDIRFGIIKSEDGVEKIFEAIYKHHSISVVNNTYHKFLSLLSTKHGQIENNRNYEVLLDVSMANFNSKRKLCFTWISNSLYVARQW